MSITAIKQEIPRDGYGRPLVIPPKGGKPVGYSRCTTYVGCLEDTYNLSRWQQRMVAIGLAESPDLMLKIASTERDDKRALDDVCEAAMERAKAHAAATIGTALHALTERIDRGQDVGVVPASYLADLRAYEQATADLTAVHIEEFMVLDELRIGGTPDRIVEYDGRLMIADLKTGSVEFGMGKIAMQLAVYAHSMLYDLATGARSSAGDIDLNTAIVIHLPAGSGAAQLLEVDIAAGWEAVAIATQVKNWRKRKGLSRPLVPRPLGTPNADDRQRSDTTIGSVGTPTLTIAPRSDALARLADAVASAPSVDALNALWNAHQDIWDDDTTALAKARRVLLETGTAK